MEGALTNKTIPQGTVGQLQHCTVLVEELRSHLELLRSGRARFWKGLRDATPEAIALIERQLAALEYFVERETDAGRPGE